MLLKPLSPVKKRSSLKTSLAPKKPPTKLWMISIGYSWIELRKGDEPKPVQSEAVYKKNGRAAVKLSQTNFVGGTFITTVSRHRLERLIGYDIIPYAPSQVKRVTNLAVKKNLLSAVWREANGLE